MKKIKLISILIIVLLSSTMFAQSESNVSKRGTTAAPFLNISQGARATGMGSSFVAIADDPSAIFWNVAGIARLENNGVLFDHTSYFAGINYNFAAVTLNLGAFGTIGTSFISSGVEEMKVTTIEEPNGTGEMFSVSDIAVSLAWAINLTEDFSIGFNPKLIYQGIWKMSSYAFAIDMGVLYNTPFDGFTLGMSITNFGEKMQMRGTSSVVLYDDNQTSTGNNGRIPAELQTSEWVLPLGFKIGVSYSPFTSGPHNLILSFDAYHPNDNYESINIGGEYSFNKQFFIRGGYKSLFLDESEESFSVGAGIKQHIMGNISLVFDYAFADYGRLDNIQKFTIGINF